MNEFQIVKKAYKLIMKNYPSSKISFEVPILGRYADLAILKRKKIITIEFKLNNWRKALEQSIDHRLGADYCYICMPRRKVSKEMKSELKKFGIGLYFFCDKNISTIIRPKKSNEIYMNAWENVYNYILNKPLCKNGKTK